MLDKPIYFYAFDYQQYMDKRSFYIDYQKQLPGPIIENASKLMAEIMREDVNKQSIIDFKNLMIASCERSYTEDFTCFLLHEIDQ